MLRLHQILLLGLLACTQPDATIEPDTPDPNIPSGGISTEVGQPKGSSFTRMVGPAGGEITLPGSPVTFTFPAGALEKETAITVQPIENKAPGGVESGYRLLPADATYKKPITATWNYKDEDIIGSTPDALGLAVQQANGTWLGWAITPDKVKKQAMASISRPQDIAFFEQFFLRPENPQVLPNESILVKPYYLKNFSGDPEEKWLALTNPEESGLASNWRINGVPVREHANADLGLAVEHDDGRNLEYLAPPHSPGSTVTISTQIMIAEKTQLLLVTNLSIYGGNTCTVNGNSVNNAFVSLANANGTLVGLVSEKGAVIPGAASVGFTIENFSGKGTYEVNEASTNPGKSIGINAYDGSKAYAHFYRSDNNQWMSGGGKITITDYIPGKLIAGSVSGTLFYTQGGKQQVKSIQSSAYFRAWIN
ncbi:hypothetical protein [Salmonirosea aquatica]|uniref:ZU5 domain-containing protein n=1 Tax=Salmonirosea aquatica TaxID=2654236 RepID=A0A7C9F7X4_9BACT|nr:hypothetical protein [Cytophagaceae bacterium SJW1-29]